MYTVDNYFIAVMLSIITMFCWGSWANTQKMASKKWPFQLFYRDYVIGVFVLSLIGALTMGSFGAKGQGFFENVFQTELRFLFYAFLGGIIFNLANLLLVAAIDKVGMAVAFPVAIGISTSLGTAINYIAQPTGTNSVLLFAGIAFLILAVVVNSIAYKKLQKDEHAASYKGIGIAIISGLLMGCFYYSVATSISGDFEIIEPGKLTPYTAVVIFSSGVLISDFLWNSNLMAKMNVWERVDYTQYFKGKMSWHFIGLLGGIIWSIGMLLSIISGGEAGYAIAFGLGNGATMIAALWGVFVWKEFKNASRTTLILLVLMFAFFIAALALIIISKI